MPAMIQVVGFELRVDGADPDEVERVETWLEDADDLAAEDLERLLADCARLAPTVGIALVAELEAGSRTLYLVEAGQLARHAVRDSVGALRALAASLDDAHRIVGTPRRASAEGAARRADAATAEAAIAARDVPALLALWERFPGTAGAPMRVRLAEALAAKPAPEAHALLVRALRDDVAAVAHAIAFRLHNQRGLEPAYGAMLDALARDLPRTRVPLARFTGAIRDYDAIALPPEARAALPQDVRVALGEPAPTTPARTRADAIGDAVTGLRRGETATLRKALRNIGAISKPETRDALRAQFAPRLAELATAAPTPTLRGLAIDLLVALGATAAELRPLTTGLPDAGAVRSYRRGGPPLPAAPLVPSPGPRPPAFAWREIAGAAPYGDHGWLVVPRGGLVHFVERGAPRWSTELAVTPQPLALAGPPGDLVYLASAWGLHALDAATGRERWSCTHVEVDGRLGAVIAPRATVWERGDAVVVQSAHELAIVERATGALITAIPAPFPLWAGLQPYGDGVLALDGTPVIADLETDAFVPRGLLLHADGHTEDVLAPRCLAAVVREAEGGRAELTATEVVVDAGGHRVAYALPAHVTAIAAVERLPDGTAVVPLKIRRPAALPDLKSGSSIAGDVTYGGGTWQALPLRVPC